MPCYEIDGIKPFVDIDSYVHPTAVIIGDVIIAKNCYIAPNAVLRGDFGQIVVEEGSNIQDCCVIHSFPGKQTLLGKNSHIGHGSVVHGCQLEEGCLIGINCTILDLAHIGANCIVGANSLVPDSFKSDGNKMIYGAPAKVIRDLSDKERQWKINGTNVYKDLAKRSLSSLIASEPERQVRPVAVRINARNHIRKKEFS